MKLLRYREPSHEEVANGEDRHESDESSCSSSANSDICRYRSRSRSPKLRAQHRRHCEKQAKRFKSRVRSCSSDSSSSSGDSWTLGPELLGEIQPHRHGYSFRVSPLQRGRFQRRNAFYGHEMGLQGVFGLFLQKVDLLEPSSVDNAQSPNLQNVTATDAGEPGNGATEVENIEKQVPAEETHENIDFAKVWKELIRHGLSKEEKKKLRKKYPVNANCSKLKVPKLNEGIVPFASKASIKRDRVQRLEQNQIGVGLRALSQAMSTLEIEKDNDLTAVQENLKDAAKMFLNAHHCITKTRQTSISTDLHKKIRMLTQNCKPDDHLFGKGLDEKIKRFRKVRRSARRHQHHKHQNKSDVDEEKPINLDESKPID